MTDRITVRRALVEDAPLIARHRAGMFRDMGDLDEGAIGPLQESTLELLRRLMPAGEYVAWLASPEGRPTEIVGGAGAQLRTLFPRPRAGGDGIRTGLEAIVLNVYTEPAWRRRGVARALMEEVIGWARRERVARLVLHASRDGRRLYEDLGFAPTNEMRFTGEL
jgi:GNAT superfamily N-acetyltransferase